MIDEQDRLLRSARGLPQCNSGTRATFTELLLWGCGFNQPSSFWRRGLFFSVGGLDVRLRFCLDYDLYLKFAQREPSGRIQEFLSCFRMHKDSKTTCWQTVREKEHAILWERYGRSAYSETRQRLHRIWYLLAYRCRVHPLQLAVCSGLMKVPEEIKLTRSKKVP